MTDTRKLYDELGEKDSTAVVEELRLAPMPKFEDAEPLLKDSENNLHARFHLDMIQKYWDSIPVIPQLNSKILACIEKNPTTFQMDAFHNNGRVLAGPRPRSEYELAKYNQEVVQSRVCGTAHCLAGWACVFVGEEGIELEQAMGSDNLGAAVFVKSTGHIPHFYTNNSFALFSLKERVDIEAKSAEQR